MNSVETVTILITDLVGSTGLESRIGPEAADELRDEHFSLLRAAIADAGGREVKNTGDGMVAAFESAWTAVGCAVSIQQRLERRNRAADQQLLIKVGISLGDATVAGGDYFGMPVIEAARLCDRAAGGQILVKEIVAHLAGGRAGDALKPVGALELKGLPEPLVTVEVAWEPLGPDAGSLPVPSLLQELPPVGFVGRAGERERLRALFEDAREGPLRLALVSGEPGIGKTRLSTLAAFEARATGATILYGRSDQNLSVPYGPWVQALSHYVENGPEEVLRAHIERHPGELARLVPALKDRLPDVPAPRETDPDTERYLLWGATADLLAEASRGQPIVLVLDDLQWADKPTLLLLKHVVAYGAEVRALLIANYRESDLARGHPLTGVLADLHRERGVERIALKGLDEPEIVEIMERAAGRELDEVGMGLAHELFGETDGNPFYTGELMRHLLESGAIYQQDDGPWAVRSSLTDLGLPQSVREVVGRRVKRLGEEAQKTLQTAAVIGREFDHELLLRLTDYSEDDLLDLLEEAVEASVLWESATVAGRFSFAHSLISHTLYEDLGTTRRARVHRRVAKELEELLGPDPEARVSELAYHWTKAATVVDPAKATGFVAHLGELPYEVSQAAPGNGVEKAIDYSTRAGDRAMTLLGYEEAIGHYQNALVALELEKPVDEPRRCELLMALGGARARAGDTATAKESFQEATDIAGRLGAGELLARGALGYGGSWLTIGVVDDALIALLEKALDALGDEDSGLRARVMGRLAVELYYSDDPDARRRRAAVSEEAVAMARRVGDSAVLAATLSARHYAIWDADHINERLAVAAEIVELSEAAGDKAKALRGHHWRLGDLLELRRIEDVDVEAEAYDRLAEELRQPFYRWWTPHIRAMRALLEGRFDEAESLSREAWEIGRRAHERLVTQGFGVQTFWLRRDQGRLEELEAATKAFVEQYPAVSAWRCVLAYLYSELDRREEAQAELDQLAADGFAELRRDGFWLVAMTMLSETCAFVGDARAASELYELLLPYWDRNAVVGHVSACNGSVSRYLGLLATTTGRWEAATRHFDDALRANGEMGARPLVSRTQTDYARMLLLRDTPGDRDNAHVLLKEALETAQELHMKGVVDKAVALDRGAGEGPHSERGAAAGPA